MKNRFDQVVGRYLSRWVALTLAHGVGVSTAVLAVTVGLLGYAALELGIDSDNVNLLAEDVPSRVALDEFAELFPILNNALLVVVDGTTPELARDGAAELADRLGQQEDQFENVFIPGGGEFFERNGLLYRSVDDLYDFTDQMARVQPMIAELERDSSIANLAAIIREGLSHIEGDVAAGEQWATILDRLSDATAGVFDEYPLAISWEEFLLSGSSLDTSTRRILMVEPVLDFESFLPAGAALKRVHDTAADLGLTRERGVVVRITGNPALNHEEMLGIAWDIAAGGVACFVLVALILFLALRSLRLVVAALATLLIGLVWTAAFATAAIGHLNLISLSFAVLFIGLGVDFAIHLGMNYADLRRSGSSHATAMGAAVDDVGSSLVLCSITTCIGFYVFIPTDYNGVAELGLISGTGMLIILFLTLTFFPAVLSSWLELPEGAAPSSRLRFAADPTPFLLRHAARIRWAALLAGLWALVLLPGIRFEPNVVHMRDPSTESVQTFNEIAKSNDRGSPWYANALADDLDAADALAARLGTLDLVSNTLTLRDFVPDEQREKREVLTDLSMILETGALPESTATPLSIGEQLVALSALRDFLRTTGIGRGDSALRASVGRLEQVLDDFLTRIDSGEDVSTALRNLEQVLLGQLPVHLERLRGALDPATISISDLPAPVVRRMIAPDGRARVIAYPSETLQEDPEALAAFVDAVRSVAPSATGLSVNMVEFARATVRSLQQALISAVIAIALVLWLLWRRVGEMVLVLIPLLLGAGLTGASMA
ncbi:MAG: MMPL family transporter, partial [Myxococcota bacterium]